MKNNKEIQNIKINFNYIEEFKTDKEYISDDILKTIFNKKYYKYIKRLEKGLKIICATIKRLENRN